MRSRALTRSEAFAITDHRCSAGPADVPFTEQHKGFSISYVRKGSFGYQRHDQAFELVAGSILVGRAGAEYRCTHDHHAGGDECLSFDLAPAVVEWIGGGSGLSGGGRSSRISRMAAAEIQAISQNESI